MAGITVSPSCVFLHAVHDPLIKPLAGHGVGPRVEEPAVGLNSLRYFTAPYEERRWKR